MKTGLKYYDDETFEPSVEERKVYEKLIILQDDSVLLRNDEETIAQYHDEIL